MQRPTGRLTDQRQGTRRANRKQGSSRHGQDFRNHHGSDGNRLTVIAVAEAFNSLFKAELIRNKGPWRSINDLEIATAEYIDWFNHRRLHGEIGYRPPIEVENEFLNSTTPAITPMERV